MKAKKSQLFSVEKASEGGIGQRAAMQFLKAAGIKCQAAYSPFVGQSGVKVFGNERIQRKASDILYGGRTVSLN